MKREQVKIGASYDHDFGDGRLWRVRVTGFEHNDDGYNTTVEWIGVLDGAQGGLEDGARVWGRISELR